jgi:hypothetical protein
MIAHLSSNAQFALQHMPVYVYHGDPSMESGTGFGHLPPLYNNDYDYLTLYPPLKQCLFFQNELSPESERTPDQTYGMGPIDNAVVCKNRKCEITEVGAVTSILDANLTCDKTNAYPDENILVHEFGHAILSIGLLNGTRNERTNLKKLKDIYHDYFTHPQLCNHQTNTAYACTNKHEMWAEATQTWFGSSKRNDVNKGIETVDNIKKNLSALYTILESTYGPPYYAHSISIQFNNPGKKIAACA